MADANACTNVYKRSASSTCSADDNINVLFLDGSVQQYSKEKLRHSIESLTWNLDIDYKAITSIVQNITAGTAPIVTTVQLSMHVAETIASYSTKHPDFLLLAGRVYVASIHKNTTKRFSTWVAAHAQDTNPPLNPRFVDLVRRHSSHLDDAIVHARDFAFTYTSIRAMAHTYLLRTDDEVVERPQFLYMRVALAAHGSDIELAVETYNALSQRMFTPASPVLFNAGTIHSNYASCFIFKPDQRNTDSRLQSARELDTLWLADGGIGLSLADVPAKRALPSPQPGILPLLRLYDAHAHYTGVARQKRPSALTVHLPIWHADVRCFIISRTTQAQRNRLWHVYPSLWIPDIFMNRVRKKGSWTLFDPIEAPALLNTFGSEFSEAYERYESCLPSAERTSAWELWTTICRAQQETGTPFMLYQDAINSKNNHAHLGLIHSSNLCTEIVQYCSIDMTAVCTLASLSLTAFVEDNKSYDFEALHAATKLAVFTTNALLDRNTYPTEASHQGALDTRAIGIGVQGLADVFMSLGFPFHSTRARQLNREIFETIYHAAYDASCDLAERDGPYPLYAGSPAEQGILQHDMWANVSLSGRYNFAELRRRISQHGLRNSMLTAQMPTASTAKLLGNFESVEPYTSNVVTYRVLSGDYTEFCPWLVRRLAGAGLWTEEIRLAILRCHGSIQALESLPSDIKELFLTAWEVDPKVIIDMAADRGPFVDQTQAMSLHVPTPNPELLLDLQMYAWERGLKTGLYYLRTQSPAHPLAFGVGAAHSQKQCTTAPDGKTTDNQKISIDHACGSCSA